MKTQGFKGLFSQLRSLPFKEVVIEDSEVRGLEIQKPQDVPAAEKILFTDVTRKKGGYLAKILNEPISLWIAKHLAKTSIRPNTVTLWNTLLGLLSAYLVYYGAKSGLYGPLALGGILFYLVDIFDGIDGELARFTFRLDKNGALYDTISDNVILIVFLGASTYAAYMQFHHWVVIALGGFTLWTALVTILYLYYFTMKHFGNASLRLYESLFMPKIPRENKFIRFVFSIRKLYTKDILAALITAALILNQPIIIMIGAPVLITLLIIGFFYMGTRYQYLLGSMSPSEI
jgi:phosphatidylglycerophosphate synthase